MRLKFGDVSKQCTLISGVQEKTQKKQAQQFSGALGLESVEEESKMGENLKLEEENVKEKKNLQETAVPSDSEGKAENLSKKAEISAKTTPTQPLKRQRFIQQIEFEPLEEDSDENEMQEQQESITNEYYSSTQKKLGNLSTAKKIKPNQNDENNNNINNNINNNLEEEYTMVFGKKLKDQKLFINLSLDKVNKKCIFKGKQYPGGLVEKIKPSFNLDPQNQQQIFAQNHMEIGSINSISIGNNNKIYNLLDKEMLLQQNQNNNSLNVTNKNQIISSLEFDENRNVLGSNQKKKIICNCKKSKCQKLYCECFANQELCSDECNCCDCFNNEHHLEDLEKARKETLNRNSTAFKSKIVENQNQLEHFKGCNCKKSNCQKKYCECFNQGVQCTKHCKCEDCKNGFPHTHSDDDNEGELKLKNPAVKEEDNNQNIIRQQQLLLQQQQNEQQQQLQQQQSQQITIEYPPYYYHNMYAHHSHMMQAHMPPHPHHHPHHHQIPHHIIPMPFLHGPLNQQMMKYNKKNNKNFNQFQMHSQPPGYFANKQPKQIQQQQQQQLQKNSSSSSSNSEKKVKINKQQQQLQQQQQQQIKEELNEDNKENLQIQQQKKKSNNSNSGSNSNSQNKQFTSPFINNNSNSQVKSDDSNQLAPKSTSSHFVSTV
ncbi:hypothetical protein PPERSA_07585 [Pseudocohnilembus persalinus]|uniref:CRC domain-containing protein n=1 Tax=Pseudocohnilembus persalinus TaxID=266149 RepID=A0A0V0QI98_PSEPJ|nr:hypothetical protein PPERSA_07585 [Pseudocohnilembus persalinus]|eukprot:KRX01940.1 hypothetical protein PPERSA_07585 [Pseudocohnilembus persalinus]